ncbi:cysteine desulfurase [Paracrocinitomix mangrovi]|uniref:aminotransferase class V-fold PLP-dependent enzyme n=1 Tax=Paracrocinitomix mangrovi TaxID=2862509 RepID=UPI001C8E1F1C|nr:cysteine desulfurase [Paracrocinitomix mangrovi]UKN00751.1 cysteine desulfurase [Paracrocinitomix mangrovi]
MSVLTLDISKIRAQFPVLKQKVGKYPLIYLDNGATSQKPQVVIDRIQQFYQSENANIHRGVHHLSQISTENYEIARRSIQQFIGAEHEHEVIFTTGTTGGINLIAQCFTAGLSSGDEIIITEMEHHSNIVPWQMKAEEHGLVLKYIPLKENGELQWEKLDELLSEKTKLLSFTHISNSLGTINPVKEIIQKAHKAGAKVLLDAAQSLQHLRVDVKDLDCDFMVFSGHKTFGPTGVGVLYGKEDLLDALPPYQGGGDMIKTVTMEKTEYNTLPFKFEAGTPNIVGGIALGTAIDWMAELDYDQVLEHEEELLNYATSRIQEIEGVKIYGQAENKSSILSFLVEGTHPYDIGTLLNQQGVAVRTGHHCTQPVMDFFKIPGTIRASFSLYNTIEEVDLFIDALNKSVNMLR